MAAFKKGGKGGPGRRPGTPNKMTAAVKDMILKALDTAGGADYLARQAEENPGPFMTLVGKVLPLQVTGDDGGPVETVQTIMLVGPKKRAARDG